VGDPKYEYLIQPYQYLEHGSGKGTAPTCVVGRKCIGNAPIQPEAFSCKDLTGRYEGVDDEGRWWTMFINGAGATFVGWVTRAVTAGDAGKKLGSKHHFRIAGDRTGEGTPVHLQDDPTRAEVGRVGVRHKRSLMQVQMMPMKLGGHATPSEWIRLSEAAAASDADITQLRKLNHAERDLLRLTLRAPLPTKWVNLFIRGWDVRHAEYKAWNTPMAGTLHPQFLDPLLESYFEVAGDSNKFAVRGARAIEIDDYLRAFFSTKAPSGWHPDDLPLARHHARQHLAVTRWKHSGHVMSHLDWLQRVVAIEKQGKLFFSQLKNLTGQLGLDGVVGDPEHPIEYQVELTVGGLAGDVVCVGLGGFIGKFRIRKNTGAGWFEDWSEFPVWFLGGSAGAGGSIQVGFHDTGDGKATADWHEKEFPGAITLIQGPSVHGGYGGGGGYGTGMMIIHGSGLHPPLVIDMGGVTISAEVGIAVDFVGEMGGLIIDHNLNPPKFDIEHPTLSQKRDFLAEVQGADAVHFKTGHSLLEPEARQVLRRFCAHHLRALRSPGAALVIWGFADRVASPELNTDLSKFRARNTAQAIKDILGQDLGIPKERISLLWLGEDAAAITEPDEVENLQWRRVDLFLGSNLVLSLGGDA
jgi:outer membrane protein OmpA-like peptidoglycan-associated protein